jgi:hypothetical protein
MTCFDAYPVICGIHYPHFKGFRKSKKPNQLKIYILGKFDHFCISRAQKVHRQYQNVCFYSFLGQFDNLVD